MVLGSENQPLSSFEKALVTANSISSPGSTYDANNQRPLTFAVNHTNWLAPKSRILKIDPLIVTKLMQSALVRGQLPTSLAPKKAEHWLDT